MIRNTILNLLEKVYDNMTPDELNEIGVFFVTGKNDKKIYCHSGFNCQSVESCKDLEKVNKLDNMAMEILKHSLSELNKSRDKHNSYNWTPEEMADYAYKMAAAMIQEGKSYE